MRLLYIDSSFFLETPKSRAMLARLVKYLQANEPDVLLISITEQAAVKDLFQTFLSLIEQVDIHLLVSPTEIHLGSINGELNEFFAEVNGIRLKPKEGSLIEIDCDSVVKTQRIYLDFMYVEPRKKRMAFTEDEVESFMKRFLGISFNSKKYS